MITGSLASLVPLREFLPSVTVNCYVSATVLKHEQGDIACALQCTTVLSARKYVAFALVWEISGTLTRCLAGRSLSLSLLLPFTL